MRSLATKMMLALGSVLIATVLILAFMSQARAKQQELDQIADQAQALKNAYESEISLAVGSALTGTTTLANTPDVVAAFASGDRARLTAATASIFDKMKAEGISQIQFHTPPATSFLRLHKPSQFGDDLTAIRATVVEANRTQKPVYGLEEGVAGWGIRTVVPVFSGGKHIGSVEFGSDFGADFLNRIKGNRGGDYFLYKLPSDTEKEPAKLRFAATGDNAPTPPAALVGQVPTAKSALWERKGDQVTILVPVADYQGKVKGYLMGVEALHFDNRTADTTFIIALIILTLVLLALTYWMLHRSLGPLKPLAARLAAMAAGDLTGEEIPVRSRDEVGTMALAFNGMMESMRKLISEVRETGQQVNAAAGTLRSTTGEVAEAADGVAQAMNQVAQGASVQSGNATQGAQMVAQLQTVIQQIATGATEQAVRAQQTAEVVTQVNQGTEDVKNKAQSVLASSQESSKAADAGQLVVDRSTAAMDLILKTVEQAGAQVRELGRQSQEISTITQAITEIADQTNLLALNAAIEAARAGEHGRGFAVVADEVRKLAERSAKSAQEIADLVHNIQEGITRSIDSMEQGRQAVAEGSAAAGDVKTALEQIDQMVGRTRRDAEVISAAASQIAAGGVSMMEAVNTMAAITQENTAATEEMAAGAQEVAGSVDSIAAVAEENAAAAEEVSASVEEMNASVAEIAQAADRLSGISESLTKEISRFRL